MGRHSNPVSLDGLEHIGVAGLSDNRHHEHITVVVDQLSQRVVWTQEGNSTTSLSGFFDALGPERTAKLRTITINMSTTRGPNQERQSPPSWALTTR